MIARSWSPLDNDVALIPVLGLISLASIVISISVAGPLSDKVGRRKPFVIVASVVMGIAFFVPVFMPSVTGMIIFTVLVGLGFGSYQAVDSALMSELLPSKDSYAKDLGVLNIAATLPQTIAPVLGGVVVLSLGYVALFPIGLVLALLGAAAIIPIKSVR